MNMNRVTPQKMNWREREAAKEQQRKQEAARAAEEERLRGVRMTQDNFPALGGAGAPRPKPMTQSGLFAKMASDWKEKEDLEAFREQQRKLDEAAEARRSAVRYMARPAFRTSRFSPQPEDMCPPHEEVLMPDSDWTTVDTRRRRIQQDLTIEEMEERDRRAAEQEEMPEDYEQNADVGENYRRNY